MCILDTLAICFFDGSLSEILFRANQVHFNKICYPEYTITMKTDIFMDRDSFIRWFFYQTIICGPFLTKIGWQISQSLLAAEGTGGGRWCQKLGGVRSVNQGRLGSVQGAAFREFISSDKVCIEIGALNNK